MSRMCEIRPAVRRLLCLAASLCLLICSTAFADAIWTPRDSFFEENYRDCEYVGRRYYANGRDGYVKVMEKPGRGETIETMANGPVLYVSMSYDAGSEGQWGLVQYRIDETGKPAQDYSGEEGATVGWIHMADLLAVYDGHSFMEEHESDIRNVDEAAMPRVAMPVNKVIYLWEYPGSEVYYNKLQSLEEDVQFDLVYEDPEGNLWGHSVYYYGHKDFWINLTSPGEEKQAADPVDVPELYPAISQEKLDNLPDTGDFGKELAVTAAGLVILTIGTTMVLIHRMAKKKNRGE